MMFVYGPKGFLVRGEVMVNPSENLTDAIDRLELRISMLKREIQALSKEVDTLIEQQSLSVTDIKT